MIYPYECPKCGVQEDIFKLMKDCCKVEKCKECKCAMKRLITVPVISGTRDGFGISKSFVDERSGKEIDTWKKWEKAGYKETVNTNNHTLNEKVKEGVKKRKHRGDRVLQNSSLPL